MGGPKPGDRGRNESGQRRREGAEPHLLAALLTQAGDLRIGQLQAPRDVVRVFEQHRAGTRQAQSTASAVEQA